MKQENSVLSERQDIMIHAMSLSAFRQSGCYIYRQVWLLNNSVLFPQSAPKFFLLFLEKQRVVLYTVLAASIFNGNTKQELNFTYNKE